MKTNNDVAAVERAKPRVVSAKEWQVAQQALLVREKAHTREADALASARRRLPWQAVDKPYVFEGPAGTMNLIDLFHGRAQLIVYHHMLKAADTEPCPGCCMFGDNVAHLAHLHARDTSLVFVAQAPIAEIEAFRHRMGWELPWYETKDDFSANFGIQDGFGLNVFVRDGDDIFRTYYTSGRGVEMLGSNWSFLDLTPYGRQETWEDSPAGYPQSAPYEWWRLHDEY